MSVVNFFKENIKIPFQSSMHVKRSSLWSIIAKDACWHRKLHFYFLAIENQQRLLIRGVNEQIVLGKKKNNSGSSRKEKLIRDQGAEGMEDSWEKRSVHVTVRWKEQKTF